MDQSLSPFSLARLWLFNLALLVIYVTGIVGVPFLKSSVLEYQNVKSDPFDGTIYPIRYVPNWLDAKYANKSIRFESIPASDFVDLPFYDPSIFEDDTDKGKIALLQRSTYITPYMGSYRMNFQEYDGSHLGVDIRAPLGTPVVSIANGIITKVNLSNGGDGIYVVVRHDGVSFNGGPKQSYYSTYLHLESALVTEGTKIAKGQILGKVGMSGVTTTPHLHFQVDKSDAPFHSYWPYNLRDAQEAGLDFFDAVNVGLGKENAIKYTVHALDFVQTLAGAKSSDNAAVDIQVAATITPAAPQNIVAGVVVAPTPKPVVNIPPLNSAPTLPDTPVTSPIVSVVKPSVPSDQIFRDIGRNSVYFTATKYLKDAGVSQGFDDATFRPSENISRRDAVIFLARAFGVEAQQWAQPAYVDIASNDPAIGYIASFKAKWVLQPAFTFRPDDTITKAEFVSLLMRLSGTQVSPIGKMSMEVATLNQFTRKSGYRVTRFQSRASVTRGEGARMLYMWKTQG